MTPTFKTVLEQAKSLTPTERTKFTKILENPDKMLKKMSSAPKLAKR